MRPLECAKLEILKFKPKNRIFRVGDTFPGPGPLFHGCPHEAAGQHSSTGYVSLGKTSKTVEKWPWPKENVTHPEKYDFSGWVTLSLGQGHFLESGIWILDILNASGCETNLRSMAKMNGAIRVRKKRAWAAGAATMTIFASYLRSKFSQAVAKCRLLTVLAQAWERNTTRSVRRPAHSFIISFQ